MGFPEACESRNSKEGDMRIGMIAPPWIPVPPPAYGGTELVVDGISAGLAGLGHDVVLVAAPGSTCPVQRVTTSRHVTPRQIGDLEAEQHHVRRAYAALRSEGVELIHDHTLSGPLIGVRVSTAPIVTTVHGPFDRDMLARYRSMPPEVRIVAISASQAGSASGVTISTVIHHGIDLGSISSGDGKGGYFAFLGRMTPEKGVGQAIAVARAAGVPLKIAAKMREPAERSYFERCVAPLLGGECEYVGELSRTEKYDFLGQATALLNPIQWDEPFGMVMIEAMAAGTPVVSTPRGAAPEIVEDGVTGCLRTEIADLAEALTTASGLNRQVVRDEVAARFSQERMAADYAAFFEAVVNEGVLNDDDLSAAG
jgi:glycosyltransferase involved in cell wall biosynthesis